jgi:hypothetical protein
MPINASEVLDAMEWVDSYYRSSDGLGRAAGLSVNGQPDFEAIAAWVSDVFVNSRLSGLSVEQCRQNVVHAIQETSEWRGRHAGVIPATLSLPYQAVVNVDRAEFLRTLYRLNLFYQSWSGLQRASGLSQGGRPDFEAIAAWIFGLYMNQRAAGRSPEEAWDALVAAIQRTNEWRSRLRTPVDASTLIGKHLMGYQAWFGTPDDGQNNGWDHWFRGAPTAENANFDLYPDTREFFESELVPTGMTMPDGRPAMLYSCHHERTLQRHFDWMADYGIDGISIGRFINGTKVEPIRSRLDGVLQRIRQAAEASGRVFFVWYDVTDCPVPTFVADLKRDWTHIVEELRLLESPNYLRHNGKPIVGVWAAGAGTCPGVPGDWTEIATWLKSQPGTGATVLMGCARDWRTSAVWRPVLDVADIIAPWAVTGCYDEASADGYRTGVVEPDLAYVKSKGKEYLPIVFPGFSWHNLQRRQAPMNSTPRLGGRFYWRQVFNVIDAGATNVFTAMFDEVDEGTAMLKMAATQAEVPVEGDFLTLDADGQALPTDWYLRLAGAAAKMVKRQIPVTADIPVEP